MGANCCKLKNNEIKSTQKLSEFYDCQEYDPTTELIFPPELQVFKKFIFIIFFLFSYINGI